MKVGTPHFTVSENVAVCCTWLAPDPDVAMTVTVEVPVVSVGAGTPPELPQPVNRLMPATLITMSRSIHCRLRRFLQPRKQSAAAIVAPGKTGMESRRIAIVAGVMDTVMVEVEAAVPEGVTVGGEKLHVKPAGKPE